MSELFDQGVDDFWKICLSANIGAAPRLNLIISSVIASENQSSIEAITYQTQCSGQLEKSHHRDAPWKLVANSAVKSSVSTQEMDSGHSRRDDRTPLTLNFASKARLEDATPNPPARPVDGVARFLDRNS